MVDGEELLKQRKIGQQIMVIRMIYDENDNASKGRLSFLRLDDIAKWTRISKDEMQHLWNSISSLYEFNICEDAAYKYTEHMPGDAFIFFFATFKKHGYLYIKSILETKKSYNPYSDDIETLAKINAKKIIDEGIHVAEEIQVATRFEDSLKFYCKFYIDRIIDVVREGYDWDVVCEMLNEDKEFTDLIWPIINIKLSTSVK